MVMLVLRLGMFYKETSMVEVEVEVDRDGGEERKGKPVREN